MTKRWRIAAALSLVAILSGLFVCLASAPREPVYEGRALTDWLYHHVTSSAAIPAYNSPGWLQADEALRAIGTNAIPTLVRMIGAKDLSAPMLKLVRWAERYRWLHIRYRSKIWQNEEAQYAFQILGTNAASAVPELIRIYEANVSPSSQRAAAYALGHIGREAQSAVPALARRLRDPVVDVRFTAVTVLLLISMSPGSDPDLLIPPLTAALKDSSPNVRWNALLGLSNFGSRARPALPEISKLLNDTGAVGSFPISHQAETTIWRIAPEKSGKAIVVEAATPMVTNGVTTEAVKFLYYGKHRTLIRAGTHVPAAFQYWSSDPRPRLTLYRGSSESDTNDHLLGEFEVSVVADRTVNISTLCVIADGQIYLCARDNTWERWAEIRRVKSMTAK